MNTPALARRLGWFDAVWIGLGSMIGAGIFSVWAPAVASAGSWVLASLCIAAVVALANAMSSAQLAGQYPTSGGTYVYGRERLGEWPGFVAGWSFVIGKTASCAAMAMTFAAYAAPAAWLKPVAIAAVLALAAVNYVGVTRTAAVTRVVVVVVLALVATALVLAWASPSASVGWVAPSTPYGVLQASGLLFFAFAGYARIATMGEEVHEPRTTIPRAIMTSLAVVLVLYIVVGYTLLDRLTPAGIGTAAPLASAVAGVAWGPPLVMVAAALASLGALLGLIAGVGRTAFAMARDGELPGWLADVHPRYRTPHHAELALAVLVSGVIAVADLRGAIGFSSFGVLLYYLVANAAAWTQHGEHRRYPRWLQAVGMLGCATLMVTLPWQSVATGAALLGVGVLGRAVLRRRSR